MTNLWSKFRAPVGSLVVDGALVFALIYYGGQITERLEQQSKRLDAIEQFHVRVNGEARLYVLERRADEHTEFRVEMRDQLQRIEEKIDKLQDRR